LWLLPEFMEADQDDNPAGYLQDHDVTVPDFQICTSFSLRFGKARQTIRPLRLRYCETCRELVRATALFSIS
jgi:hypothetical protein